MCPKENDLVMDFNIFLNLCQEFKIYIFWIIEYLDLPDLFLF